MKRLSCVASLIIPVVLGYLAGRIIMGIPAVSTTFLSGASIEGGTIKPVGEVDTSANSKAKRLGLRRPNGPYVVIDRYCNKIYLRTADAVILEASCSTGSGAELTDSISGRQWKFDTPPGIFEVTTRLKNPWWRKPDWAYIEEGTSLPAKEADRFDDEMMGDYAIGFGDGYFIHGTIYERLLGVSVTHGCVRMGSKDLKVLYERTRTGTQIYVY